MSTLRTAEREAWRLRREEAKTLSFEFEGAADRRGRLTDDTRNLLVADADSPPSIGIPGRASRHAA